MRDHFAEVLARERACLDGVTNGSMLAAWGHGVIGELLVAQSPYALALHPTDEVTDRADFLDRWRELIAETVDRLVRSGVASGTPGAPAADIDGDSTAVLVLGALHGGSILCRVAQDPWPLDAALDLALAPLITFLGGAHATPADETSPAA